MKRYTSLIMAAAIAVAANGEIPAGYYDRVQGKTGSELKEAVRQSARFHKKVTYDKLWDAYYDTDVITVDGVEYWFDMYCNEWRLTENGRWEDPNATTKKVVFNREHCVPNSWWGHANNDCYTDLHHLFISETKANIAKSNNPMGLVDVAAFNNGCLKVGTPKEGYGGGFNKVFEPDDRYKGNFARAYMYVFTMYPDITWNTKGSSSSSEDEGDEDERDVNLCMSMLDLNSWQLLQPWAKNMLTEWSDADPVDELEAERNEVIYELWQFNRNPFIDLPGIEDYIYGNKTEEAYMLPDGVFADTYHPKGDGSEQNPYNVSGCVDACRKVGTKTTEESFYVGGYVLDLDEDEGISVQYGNATWTLCDDPEGAGDHMQIYRVKNYNGSKFTKTDEVKPGDYVVVYAPIQNQTGYNARTYQGNLVSVNQRGSSDVAMTGIDDYIATYYDVQGRRITGTDNLAAGFYVKVCNSGIAQKVVVK